MSAKQKIKALPDENIEKRAARLFLYKHALAAPVQGHAVTLAGPYPEVEVDLMRSYLKWPAHRTWFVDSSRTQSVVDALIRAKQLWPEVNVKNMMLEKLAPKLEAIGFANLDFMGSPLQFNTIECFREVSDRLLPKAIVGFTWMRGREYVEGVYADRLLYDLGKGFKGNERRWAGMLRGVDLLSNGTLELIDRWEYTHNHSPMSVAVFRKE